MNLVVFHDHGGHWLDFLLKRGFKHCFCVVQDGDYMIRIDGLNSKPKIDVVAGSSFDLRGFYAKEGFTVIEVEEGTPMKMPFTLNNCVGMVKTVLGIRAFGAVTPFQLYRRLSR